MCQADRDLAEMAKRVGPYRLIDVANRFGARLDCGDETTKKAGEPPARCDSE